MKNSCIMYDGIGKVIVPLPSKEETHLFGLYDQKGEKIDEGYFENEKVALAKAKMIYEGSNMRVKDLDVERYLELSRVYRKRIKELHKSFKITMLVLDFTEWFRSTTCNCYYTYLRFTYKEVKWVYREDASGDWIDKI